MIEYVDMGDINTLDDIPECGCIDFPDDYSVMLIGDLVYFYHEGKLFKGRLLGMKQLDHMGIKHYKILIVE